jgi:hypothetical protein
MMTNWIFNAYSDVYTTAMMQNVKTDGVVAIAKKTNANRFSKLVRMLGRA